MAETLDLEVTEETVPEEILVEEIASSAEVVALTSLPKEKQELQEIRAVHHKIAAMVANDYKVVEVARATGYAPTYISSLVNSPAMKDLVAHYEACREERFSELQSRTECASLKLLDQLEGRLDDPDETIPFAVLADTTFKMMDRAGQGPVKRSESKNVNLNVSTELLARVREEAVEARFVPRAADPPALESGGGSGVGGNGAARPVAESGSRPQPIAEERAAV
jgi:hypothetical protein